MKKVIESYMQKKYNERIRARREKIGLSITEAAKRAGVSQPAWSKWELGVFEPRGANRLKVAEVLGCNPEWLRTGEEPEERMPPVLSEARGVAQGSSAPPYELDSRLMERVKDSVLRAIRNSGKKFSYNQKVTLVARVYAICLEQGLDSPLELDDQDLQELLRSAS